jgi:hypothetical protein
MDRNVNVRLYRFGIPAVGPLELHILDTVKYLPSEEGHYQTFYIQGGQDTVTFGAF